MKKFHGKIAFAVAALLLVTLCTPLVCMAFEPASAFCVDVYIEGMPEGTAFLDLLLPLDEDDECFVPFCKENGEKAGIGENAEIVRYREDGYVSYTFHYKDAFAESVPESFIDFFVESEVYDAHKELFAPLEQYEGLFHLESHYALNLPFGSDLEKDVRALFAVIKKPMPDFGEVRFCKWGEKQFEEIRGKCADVKMAYLDKDGNVLAVTNAVKIRKNVILRGDVLIMSLSGNVLRSDVRASPWEYLSIIVNYLLALFALTVISLVVTAIVILIDMRKKKRKT